MKATPPSAVGEQSKINSSTEKLQFPAQRFQICAEPIKLLTAEVINTIRNHARHDPGASRRKNR
jgi:hypothetical protein